MDEIIMHQNGQTGSRPTFQKGEPPGTTGITGITGKNSLLPGELGGDFNPIEQDESAISLDPEVQLARDWALFLAVENGTSENHCRCWQPNRAVVVLGRNNHVASDVVEESCAADGVKVLRRGSGGGTVVLAHGCLAYAVVLSTESWPELTNVAASFGCILERIVAAIDIPGLSVAGGTDLALDGRKVSGNAQRRGHRALIHHGTLLFDFDPRLATRYLREPGRQPAYRMARRHAEFLGNIPLPAETIRARLESAWNDFRLEDVTRRSRSA